MLSPRCIPIISFVFILIILNVCTSVWCINIALPGEVKRYQLSSAIRTGVDVTYAVPDGIHPYRLEVSSWNAQRRYPVFVVVRQEKSVTSWQLPLLVESHLSPSSDGLVEYHNSARTLCNAPDKPTMSQINPQMFKANFTVSLSTFSPTNVEVVMKTVIVKDYFIKTDVEYEATFSPSEPVYFAYNFPENNVKTVMLQITSEDDVCFTVSVQPNICPIYDLNDHITYQGKYQTVTKKGGLAIHRKHFPQNVNSFVVVFVAKADNYDCDVSGSVLFNKDTRKLIANKQISKVKFRVRTAKKQGEYAIAIFSLLGFNVILVILILILTYLFYRFGSYYNIADYDQPQPFVEPNIDVVDAIQNSTEPRLVDFIYHGKRNNTKALNYFWHIGNIAIFYGLPVIQLMVFYQRAVNYSGDLDLCYFNNQCSHPLYFTDFNHVYSNIGYIIFGTLFLIITAFRNLYIKNRKGCGIPKLHGLYYAMGIALIFEGVLSGCYHICPNQSNFQFDTSFMYVMAILIMAKLYQNRHPDVHASAYSTFTILGLSVVLAMFGILYNSMAVLIIFFVAYVLFCVYMTFKIYFFTNIVRRVAYIYNELYVEGVDGATVTKKPLKEVLYPKRGKLFIFLMIGNLVNLTMAIGGFFLYPEFVDFGTYLLVILMGNAIMHAIFYTVMKIATKGESICFEAILYGLLSLALWMSGGYFFFNAATQWNATPAESRLLNQECMVLDFYDTHDIWHILSAPALFFSFLFLMALDDDLYDKSQEDIKAF